ncbi:MAG: type II toxin-antitoxin system RelE/ParE family toxin [Rhodomicrobium sp.]
MRVDEVKGFARFQRRERIAEKVLVKAIRDAGAGLVDADLGGGLIKQRVARKGEGKSGGYRTVIAFRRGERAVFLFGFAKSDLTNIDDDELEKLRVRGRAFLALKEEQLAALTACGELLEVSYVEIEQDEG